MNKYVFMIKREDGRIVESRHFYSIDSLLEYLLGRFYKNKQIPEKELLKILYISTEQVVSVILEILSFVRKLDDVAIRYNINYISCEYKKRKKHKVFLKIYPRKNHVLLVGSRGNEIARLLLTPIPDKVYNAILEEYLKLKRGVV